MKRVQEHRVDVLMRMVVGHGCLDANQPRRPIYAGGRADGGSSACRNCGARAMRARKSPALLVAGTAPPMTQFGNEGVQSFLAGRIPQ